MKHSEETRAKALEMMKESGVSKTHEEMGISLQTLYKWRNDEKKTLSASTLIQEDGKAVLEARQALADSEAAWADERERLVAENMKLREENAKLRGALRALVS